MFDIFIFFKLKNCPYNTATIRPAPSLYANTQRRGVLMKSDSRTSDSLNVFVNQTIKLARKNINTTSGCASMLGQKNLQHTGVRERLLKTYKQLSNVLVKKYYGWWQRKVQKP